MLALLKLVTLWQLTSGDGFNCRERSSWILLSIQNSGLAFERSLRTCFSQTQRM